ncbi:hypothetical protein INR49_009019 [Caranx melampygus]|nr:hypothetical protein INR49_009019 [Caranx melampygus]
MEHRTNSRGVDEYFLVHSLPRAELHVSHLKHDTDQVGLRVSREIEASGPRGSRAQSGVQWWSLAVKAEDVVSAERRLWEETSTSPLRSRPGPVRSPGEVCKLPGPSRRPPGWAHTASPSPWRRCCKLQPADVLYKQEVMYVVLVHSPANQKFEDYPLLRDDPNAICVYRDGGFIWRCQAMVETHRYQLVQRPERNQVEAVELSGLDAKFYVWDHVAVACTWRTDSSLLFGRLKTTWLPFLGLFEDTEVVKSKCLCLVLSFDDVRLRQSLTFCDRGDGSYHHSFDHLEDADGWFFRDSAAEVHVVDISLFSSIHPHHWRFNCGGHETEGGAHSVVSEDTVQDITVKLPDIMRSHPEVHYVIHAGAHDVDQTGV